MKKSNVTRELANIFPPWSRIRQDEQSVGFQFLNTLAIPMDRMDKQLIRSKSNYYLTTINLDEIDLTYRMTLPTDFTFQQNYSDPLNPISEAPTVSGLINSIWYEVTLAESNSVENFWYNSIPNRISLENTVSGIDDSILISDVSDLPVTGVWEHHLSGGHVWVKCEGGTEYLSINNGQALRGKVIIEGTTRKGTQETESLIFPWDMKQKSKKEWEKIESVTAFNMENTVQLEVSSSDFNNSPYISIWNTRFSENRNKIDEFWGLGDPIVSGLSVTLDRTEYISDEWQQLVQGFSGTQVREQWELLDGAMDVISGLDLALEPFSDNVWVLTSDSKLMCYDIAEDMPSGISMIKDKTAGSDVLLELEQPSVVLGENILFLPWHARLVKEILKYRLWYQTPSGTKYGLYGGSTVSFTSDFWVGGSTSEITRNIEGLITLTPAERGEYLIVLEVIFIDEEEQTEKVIVPVNYKIPKVALDISSLISETPIGIEFSSDQKLWVKGQTKYYQFDLHTDTMVIDYHQNTLYFKENYEEVIVDSDE